MIRNIKLASAGLALAGAVVLNPLSAAMKPGDYLNGQWGSTEGGSRGATLTYVPDPAGGGELFALIFSYNESTGENTWLVAQASFLEHQFQSSGGEIFLTDGGSFTNPPVDPGQTAIGTFDVTLNSCNSVTYEFDFDDGSGFPDATYELDNLTERTTGEPTAQCVYTEEFTGCPDFATGSDPATRSCFVSGSILDEEITLTNDATWVLDGLLEIGDSERGGPITANSTLNIEPGTVIIADPNATSNAYIYVHAGSKIFADGTPNAPIVLTSFRDGFDPADSAPVAGDTGGLVIAGLSTCNTFPDSELECTSEFATADQVLPYGGTDPDDDSGSISYFQVRYGGIPVGVDQEVNSFTFLSVGRQTRAHHLQAYNGLDDGFEMFGGTLNLRYITVVDGADDYLDWDEGYDGQIQFGLIVINDEEGAGSGIEASNSGSDLDNQPRATPVLSNFTIVRPLNDEERGLRLKDGTGGQIWNSVVTGFGSCIAIEDQATIDAAPDNIAFAGNVINCPTNFGGDDPALAETLFDPALANLTTDPMLDATTLQPMAGSPVFGNAVQVIDLDSGEANQFFDAVPYSGAFDGETDWLEGWTFDPFGVNR